MILRRLWRTWYINKLYAWATRLRLDNYTTLKSTSSGQRGNEVVYVQAAYLITEEKTFNREFGNLMSVKDNYPKYVISMTPYMDSSKWEGIIHIPFAVFLKEGFIKRD